MGTTYSNTTPESNDGFSFHRVVALARFYGPLIEKQTLYYVSYSVIVAIVTLLPLTAMAQVGLYTILWGILGLAVQMAPCILAKSGDSRIIERLIPASVAEKMIFFTLYFIIFLPCVSYLIPYASIYLYTCIPSIHTDQFDEIIGILLHQTPLLRIVNIIGTVATIFTCLYVVRRARTNRILKGILSVFAVGMGMGILGAIWGVVMAFQMGFCDGLVGNPAYAGHYAETFKETLIDSPLYYVTGGIIFVYLILMVYLNVRLLKKQNL